MQRAQVSDKLDNRFGFTRYKESIERVGWLVNMHPVDLIVYPVYICELKISTD